MKRGLLVRWLGVVLGLVLPGLGHVCYRRFGRGFFFAVLGWGAVSLTLVLVATVGSPWGLALAAPWIPFVLLYMSWDAFRTVRPASPDERNEKPWWLVCMAAVGLLLATAALYEASIYYSPLRMGRVEGRSMSRTLEAGERVVLDMSAYDGGMPALKLTQFRGDPILLRGGGTRDVENQTAVRGGVPTADGRARSVRTYARRPGSGVRTVGPGHPDLGRSGGPRHRHAHRRPAHRRA